MSKVMVRYRIKPERVADNEELVRAVYDELHQTQPEGIRYATFRLQDGVSFVHIAIEDDELPGLPQVAAFQEFTQKIADRCDEQPVVTVLHQIGSFGFHQDG